MLDFATLLSSTIVTLTVSAAVLGALWRQHGHPTPSATARNRVQPVPARHRVPGYWFVCAAMHLVSVLLFALRGHIPDGLSIVGAGALIIGGLAALYVGLARYLAQPVAWRWVLEGLGLFLLLHAWLTFVHPSLFARNINTSLAMLLFCGQSAWLIGRHAPPALRPESTIVASVLWAIVALNVLRIVVGLQDADPATDMFRQGWPAKFSLLAYQATSVALTVSLLLMVNRSLLSSMESELAERRQSETALRLSEERLTRAEMATKAGNWELHLDSATLVASQGAGAIYGAAPNQLDYAAIRAVPLDAYRPAIDAALTALVHEGRPYDIEFKIRSRDTGEIKDIHSQATYDRNRNTVFGVIRDITSRKEAEAQLELAASVFSNAREGIMITDALSRFVDVNASFTRITGYDKAEVLGKTPSLLASGRQSRDFFIGLWQTVNEHGFWSGEIWNRRKDGSIYAEQLTISEVRDAQGAVTNYVGLFSDITQLKSHQEQLERMAHYDLLTGLPNRKLLADRLRQGVVQSQRRGTPLAVVFLDLDGFKAVNDQYGHAVGDLLLVEMAQRLKAVLREGDTLARVGGDEFIAVLVDLESLAACEVVLQRLLGAAAEPFSFVDNRAMVSTSIGFTLFPQDDVEAELLIRHADQAMYEAKQSGKNRYCQFNV